MAAGLEGESGTCEVACARVEQYFTQLRETLLLQEAAARSAVDTHVRERLCSLRQLQEDLATWLSQVSLASGHFLGTGCDVLKADTSSLYRVNNVSVQSQRTTKVSQFEILVYL